MGPTVRAAMPITASIDLTREPPLRGGRKGLERGGSRGHSPRNQGRILRAGGIPHTAGARTTQQCILGACCSYFYAEAGVAYSPGLIG